MMFYKGSSLGSAYLMRYEVFTILTHLKGVGGMYRNLMIKWFRII
jgi:hypothetical protein